MRPFPRPAPPAAASPDADAALLAAADAADSVLLRLFLCACVRRGIGRAPDWRLGQVVLAAERHAGGLASAGELRRAARRAAAAERTVSKRLADSAWDSVGSFFVGRLLDRRLLVRAADAAVAADEGVLRAAVRELRLHPGVRPAAPEILTGLLAAPPGLPGVDPAWLWRNGGTVRDVVRRVIGGGELTALPVLADALMDAGCEDGRLLSHLRFPHAHLLPHGTCRGCWVLDALGAAQQLLGLHSEDGRPAADQGLPGKGLPYPA